MISFLDTFMMHLAKILDMRDAWLKLECINPWAKNGILTIRDLLNIKEKRWLNIGEIKQITNSSIVDKYRDLLLQSLPQNLDLIHCEGSRISIGKWLLTKNKKVNLIS